MNDPPENVGSPRERLDNEYEDPYFHDEDEPISPEETPSSPLRLPARGKATRKLPPRRRYEYED